MATNKKKSGAGSGTLSPKAYIQSGQARKLPIHKCLVKYGILLLEHCTGPFKLLSESAIKLFKNYVTVKALRLVIEALKDGEKRKRLIDLLVG
jgi:hypothetical protein